ncbi:MAG: tetratricopeptide repeat protein, partial [Gemmatimonadota bacterium]
MEPDFTGNEDIQRFAEHFRRNPDSLVFARLADAFRKAGDPERALEILRDGIRRHPDYASAHIVRARALEDLERPSEAEASLRRVLELDAQNLVAMRGLAELAER